MSVGETREAAAIAEASTLDIGGPKRLLWGALLTPVSEKQKPLVSLDLGVFICRKQE